MEFESRVGDAVSSAPLRVLVKEDFETHFRSWGRPGLHALLVYRLLNVAIIRNVYGMEISPDAVIGRRVMIGHHQALQIPAFCVIGDGTLLRHNVNIGFGTSDKDPYAVPHLGRDVQLGSGCALLGPIRIGHGARIGPNCVVISNVPDGATLMAPAPRMFKAAAHTPVGQAAYKPGEDASPEVRQVAG